MTAEEVAPLPGRAQRRFRDELLKLPRRSASWDSRRWRSPALRAVGGRRASRRAGLHPAGRIPGYGAERAQRAASAWGADSLTFWVVQRSVRSVSGWQSLA